MNFLLEDALTRIQSILGEHLDDITIERCVLGLFFTGVKLSTGHGGICFTPIKDMPEAVCCPSSAAAMPLSGRLRNRAARAALKDVSHQNSLRKAIAIATMNALSEYIRELQPERRKRIEYGVDAFDVLTLANYKKTVVVGALVPLLKRLINEERSFHVLEQDVRTLKGKELEHYVPASEFLRVVPAADLLVITGVTMLNDTLPELLDQAKSGAEVLVTGP
ncbi:MAG TPA: DUF364 domain-containing protein, partial [Clostridiaceae bacterium]|nr:DUF364 domain-containing protein [Clostridiaceae bacterium]